MSLENFNRQYRVQISPNNGGGFEFGGEPFPLHISFSFQKADVITMNTGQISVWNLSPEQRAILIDGEENCKLTLWAGYGDRLFQIFSGLVSFSTTSMDGADWKTDIEVIDSLESYKDTYVALSYADSVSYETIVKDTVAQMGLPIETSYNVEFGETENGFSYVGSGEEMLSKCCACTDAAWTIQDGEVHVKKPNDTMNRDYKLISADTGMIEIPKRVIIAGSTETGDKIVGWDVKFLLNAAIGVDDYIYLKSKVVSGYYRVYSLQYSGDNMAGDWVCNARLVEPTGSSTGTNVADR
jgi:hypothetical protein